MFSVSYTLERTLTKVDVSPTVLGVEGVGVVVGVVAVVVVLVLVVVVMSPGLQHASAQNIAIWSGLSSHWLSATQTRHIASTHPGSVITKSRQNAGKVTC